MSMYRMRRVSTVRPQAPQPIPKTPKSAATDPLTEYFEQLRRQDGIALPYQERNSPSKRRKTPGHDAVKHMHYLFCSDRSGAALSHALETFRLQSPSLCNIDDKLNHLLETLTIAVNSAKKNVTPRSQRQWQAAPSSMGPPTSLSKVKHTPTSASSRWPPPRLQSRQIDNRDAPTSPTFSIKALSNKHVPKLALDHNAKYPVLPTAMAEKPEVATTAAGITSVDTSFATSANISFQFSQQQGSQEPGSPATSVDCTQGTTVWGSPASSSVFDAISGSKDINSSHSTKPGSSIPDEAFPDELETLERRSEPLGAQHRTNDALIASNNTVSPEKKADNSPIQASKVKGQTSGPAREATSKDLQVVPAPPHPRVKRIPVDGIACGFSLGRGLSNLPFDLQWESARLMQACNFSVRELKTRWRGSRTFESLRDLALTAAPASFQSKLKTDYQDCSFHIKMRWTDCRDNSKPLFKLEILQPRRDRLNSWQTKYGSDRILFVELDPIRKPPKFLDFYHQKEHILQHVLDLLDRPQDFLGRTWRQLHVQEKKSNKRGDADAMRSGVYRFLFFATTGDNGKLPPFDLCEPVGWAMPMPENNSKPYCKSFARFDLFVSGTTETFSLAPHEIMVVKDHYATEDPPDKQFNDERYASEFDKNEVYEKLTVMNDGCSEVPESTMRQIGLALGLSHTPSAAQFRCRGAKGMIFRSRPTDEDDEQPDTQPAGPKLILTESQVKVTPKDHHPASMGYDRQFYMLRINAVSHSLSPSALYKDFLPILVSCGVPSTNIEKLAMRQADSFSEDLLTAIKDRQKFRDWLYEHGAGCEAQQRENDIPCLADFPRSGHEKAVHMLESGFEPTLFEPLARLVKSEIKSWTDFMIRAFRLVLPRSTMAFAVADQTGVLRPGEVHICFSNPFYDRTTGKSWSSLDCDVLIGRNPSARASDIQRVKAVYKHELSHIQDVLVFSRKGPRPLADKLSGGDYDGDRFWLCWEPTLVKPFKNVPAPQQLPDPSTFGIEIDTRKLGDIVKDPKSEEDVRRFVRMGTENRLKSNLLGVVTKIHERVVYMEGLFTPRAIKLTNLKDLLIDSDKNGYAFDQQALDKLKKENGLVNLPTPAYFEYTGSKGAEEDGSIRYEDPDHKNIIDRIYFWTLKPKFEKTLVEVWKKLADKANTHDASLTADYEKMVVKARTDPAIKVELDHLRHALTQLKDMWRERMNVRAAANKAKQYKKASELWDTAILDCRAFYCGIQPLAVETDTKIKQWVLRSGYALTPWDRLKASALAKLHTGNMMWYNIAAPELCQLKADSFPRSRTLTLAGYTSLLPRKRKQHFVDEDDDMEFEGDVETGADGE